MSQNVPALKVFQSVVGCVGILGNGLVCSMIYKYEFMHTITNALIFNQSLIDMLGSLLLLCITLIPKPSYPLPPGALGEITCYLWLSGFCHWAMFVASTLNLVVLTLERYLAIVFPFRYQSVGTQRYVKIAVVLVWLLGFIITTGSVLFTRKVEDGRCRLQVNFASQMFGVGLFGMAYFIPVLVMMIVYVHIAVVLKRKAGQVDPAPSVSSIVSRSGAGTAPAPESQGGSLMRARRNTVKTLLIVSVAFVICWTPNQVIYFLFNIGVRVDFRSTLFYMSIGMAASNSCLNPYIYALKYKQFRKALKMFFKIRGAALED